MVFIVRLIGQRINQTEYLGAYRAANPLHAIVRAKRASVVWQRKGHIAIVAEIAPFPVVNAK